MWGNRLCIFIYLFVYIYTYIYIYIYVFIYYKNIQKKTVDNYPKRHPICGRIWANNL